MNAFSHLTPTRITFGAGTLDRTGEICAAYGQTALVVCGSAAMARFGHLDQLRTSLAARNVSMVVFDGVSPDPKTSEVNAAIDLARASACDVVIGLGGGSALDAAKSVGVGIAHDDIAALIGRTLDPSDATLPVVAIPTTAGSGAEVTRGAILTDADRNVKSGIRGDAVFPREAVIDPDLTATVPHAVACETAFDALTHVIEGYLARQRTPITEVLAERALVVLGTDLYRVAAGDRSPQTREAMSFAALLGGLNVAVASTCLPHRLQQAMGAVPRLSVPHGRGLSAVYPAWLSAVQGAAPDRTATIARLLGGGTDLGLTVAGYLSALDLPSNLASCGVSVDDLDALVQGVTGNVGNDPIDAIDMSTVRAMYEAALTPSPSTYITG